MLSPTRLAAAFAASCIRWTYRAVVDTFRWPSSFPIAGRLSPSASALDAYECLKSWTRTSSSPALVRMGRQ